MLIGLNDANTVYNTMYNNTVVLHLSASCDNYYMCVWDSLIGYQ